MSKSCYAARMMLASGLSLLPLFLLLPVGAAGGFLSGLLGVGGGIIFVPALYFILSHAGVAPAHVMHMALGSSLAIVVVTVLASARAHHRRGAVDKQVIRSWAGFLLAGVATGVFMAAQADTEILKRVFAAATLLVCLYMLAGREKLEPVPSRFLPPAVQRLLCVVIGMVAAMTGMGGAIMTIPLMTLTGQTMTRAVGTGAAMGIWISLPAMAGYILAGWPHAGELPPLSLGYVSLPVVLGAGLMAVVAVPFGVKVAHGLDRAVLRRIFAVVLALVSLRMFFSL